MPERTSRTRLKDAEQRLYQDLASQRHWAGYSGPYGSYKVFTAYLVAAIATRLFNGRLPRGAVDQMMHIAARAANHAATEVTRLHVEVERNCDHRYGQPVERCGRCYNTRKWVPE